MNNDEMFFEIFQYEVNIYDEFRLKNSLARYPHLLMNEIEEVESNQSQFFPFQASRKNEQNDSDFPLRE